MFVDQSHCLSQGGQAVAHLNRRTRPAGPPRLRESGCPKINLQVRSTNTDVIEFYPSLGYLVEDVVNLGKRLDHDGPRPETPPSS